MNELKVISLNNCLYSMAAKDLINNIKKSDKVNVKIIHVPYEDKEKYKKGVMKTFPQIYFNNKLIGGFKEFKEIYNFIQNKDQVPLDLNNIISMLRDKTELKKTRYMLILTKYLLGVNL